MGLGVTPSRPPGLGRSRSLAEARTPIAEPQEIFHGADHRDRGTWKRCAASVVMRVRGCPLDPAPNPRAGSLSQRDVPKPPVQLRIGGVHMAQGRRGFFMGECVEAARDRGMLCPINRGSAPRESGAADRTPPPLLLRNALHADVRALLGLIPRPVGGEPA
jgi:hypothetical protein